MQGIFSGGDGDTWRGLIPPLAGQSAPTCRVGLPPPSVSESPPCRVGVPPVTTAALESPFLTFFGCAAKILNYTNNINC